MTTFYKTTITEVGPDVAELVEGGVLILFAAGAPPELAEVSVLHEVIEGPSAEAPQVGARLAIGRLEARLTAIGHLAWAKIAEIGHVVINFDGAATSHRPGELNASRSTDAGLMDVLVPGATIVISD